MVGWGCLGFGAPHLNLITSAVLSAAASLAPHLHHSGPRASAEPCQPSSGQEEGRCGSSLTLQNMNC